jgi:hypothetical protein
VRAAWIAIALALVGCDPRLSRTRAAITAGAEDRDDDAVAALVRDGEPICTATLVAPDVLLTAAHCVEIAPTHAFFGAAPPDGEMVPVVWSDQHPDFDPVTLEHDLAVAVLAEPAAAAPWPLPDGPLDPLPGRPLRLVGFGAVGADDTGPALRRTGASVIDSASAVEFRFGPSPSQTCAGDSGGPAFVVEDGVEVLVGVTSSGDPDCAVHARDARVDVEVDGFLAPYGDPGCSASPPLVLVGMLGGWLRARRSSPRPMRRCRKGRAASGSRGPAARGSGLRSSPRSGGRAARSS